MKFQEFQIIFRQYPNKSSIILLRSIENESFSEYLENFQKHEEASRIFNSQLEVNDGGKVGDAIQTFLCASERWWDVQLAASN